MGTGVSKDAATLTPSHKVPKKHTTWKSKPPNAGTTDVVRVGLTKLGFSPSEITISEGQVVSFNWNVASGSHGHNIRQVVFDGQTAHLVQGGYNSGSQTMDGNFDIHFNLQGEFKFISDGYDTNSSKILHVTVKTQNYVQAELTEEQFSPSILHIQQGNYVKWVWNSLHEPRSIQEVKLCPKHSGILKTTRGVPSPMQSGSYKHDFPDPGLFYFQTCGSDDDQMKLCIVHVKAVQQHHSIEVTDRRFHPRLLTVTQGDHVSWIWDRFKCKKKHRILQMEVPTGHSINDPFPRPVKGGFSSDAPSRAGMLTYSFKEPGVYYYCDNNYEDNREYLGVVVVNPRAQEHHIEVTTEGFYPDLSVVNSGDRIWWNWEIDTVQDIFSVLQVDSCVASDSKTIAEIDCNNFCTHLTKQEAAMLTSVGMATVQLNTPGVYHFRVSDTPVNVGCYSVIVNPGQKDHCIRVSDHGFEPKVLRVNPGDSVWWVWENTKHQHNVIQVSGHGHPIKDGFCSGLPQDSPAAFVSQFSAGAVVYYQSVALPKLYGAVVAVSQAQVHQVLVSKNHLQPDPVLARTGDCVAWVWPVLRKHGLTQLTNTQQVFELQTYTQDVVTPRRCCALRFSNPGVYHYYSKAFSNKTDKFMYEHSSKTVLSSVVVSNASGPMTVLVSSKGFKPPSVNIHRGQGVLWSWKGSQSETHNIVHANPPTHERPYSTVTGPLAFSSGNPEPNNSFQYTFEESGSFYATSEGAPGCVGVVHVLDNESLSSVPVIVSGSNGGVVERFHNVQLQSISEEATILYTLDGSIPELHANSTRVFKSDKGINLRWSGLHIIRAIAIDSGALPSQVFTSKRFWVLEGNVGHSSEDDDALSVATEDFEAAEAQNATGVGPTNNWQWRNCAPSITGWLHNSSDSSIEIYWVLPIMPYRDQLKAYQLYVNGICYHNYLPPTCNSITIEGLTGNKTFIVSIIAQPRDSSLLQQESNRLRVTCPTIFELGGPILSCEMTDQEDTINLVWTSLDSLYSEAIKYLIYMEGRQIEGQVKTIGNYKKYPLTLPPRDVHQPPISVFILALPGGDNEESEGFLSNQIDLDVPLCLDNIYIPSGGSLVAKPLLIIKEGSGNPPDPTMKLLPSVERQDSLDGSITTVTQGDTPQGDGKSSAPTRSLECEETFQHTSSEAPEQPHQGTQTDDMPSDHSESHSVSNACMNTELNPTGSQNTELNPTGSQNTELNPTGSQNTELNPTGSQNTGLNPTGSQNTDLNPTGSQNIGLNPTGSQNTELNPTGSQNTDLNPTGSQNTGLNPTGSQNTELNPTGSQNTELNPTGSQNTELNPTGSQNTELNPTGSQNITLNHTPEDSTHEQETKGLGETKLTTIKSPGADELYQDDADPLDQSTQMLKPSTQTSSMESLSGKDVLADEGNVEMELIPSSFPNSHPSAEIRQNAHSGLGSETQLPRPNKQDSPETNMEISDEAVTDDETGAVMDNPSESHDLLLPSTKMSSETTDIVSTSREIPQTTQLPQECTHQAPAKNQHQEDTNSGSHNLHVSQSVESNCSLLHDAACVSRPLSARVTSKEMTVVNGETDSLYDGNAQDGTNSTHLQDIGTSSTHLLDGVDTSDTDDDSEVEDTTSLQDQRNDSIGSTRGDQCKQPPSKQEEDIALPNPVVSVRSQPMVAELRIHWQIASSHHSAYGLHHYNVCLAGRQFEASISSHSSQDVHTDSGETEIEHSWNAGRSEVFIPSGLMENTSYKVTVHATYHHKTTAHRSHIKTTSRPVTCTTGGKPQPPKLWVKSVSLQEAILAWMPGPCHEDIDIMGYQVTRNGKPMSEIVPYGKTEKLVKNLQPDAKHYFTISVVTTNAGQSKASNLMTVRCPEVPDAPAIRQERSTQDRSAVISWHRQKNKQLSSYRVFVDDKLHGEVKAKISKKHTHHKYLLNNLKSDGHQYKVTVKACSGWTTLKKAHLSQVTCVVLSAESNALMVTCCPSLSISLDLKLGCIHADGVDLNWVVLDKDQESDIKGFIVMVNGHPYNGSILPASITHATLSDLSLGSTFTVQVIAVTQSLTLEDASDEPTTSEAIDEALQKLPQHSVLLSDMVQVTYDHLVQAPSKVWCELVTSHSTMVVWERGRKPRKHFVEADSYTVTWWELSKKSGEPPQSRVTSDDHLLIDGLDLGIKYCITVQAQAKHSQPHEQRGSSTNPDHKAYYVPVLSHTESVTITTASPPEPPCNLTVASVGASTIQLKWDSPTEKGSEVTGLRIYVTTVISGSVQTVRHLDLLPDVTSAIIKQLQEAETYSLHLVTVTDEFFDNTDSSSARSPQANLRKLPDDWNLVPVDCLWLPCVSITTTTVGISPPDDLSCNFSQEDAVILTWRAPGCEPETVKKYEVQWTEVRNGSVGLDSDPHEVLEIANKDEMTSCEIPGLRKGKTYSMTVTAVIARQDSREQTSKRKGKKRSQARETLSRLASEPCVVHIPAPCNPPEIVLTGFGPSWVDVYWEKPLLVTLQKNKDDGNRSTCLRCILLGYKLRVNGAIYASLKPSTQRYTVQCTPAKTYEISLIAVTTMDRNISRKLGSDRNHHRHDSAEFETQCDKAFSNTVTVTLPKQQSGSIVELSAKFCPSSESQSDEAEENNELQGDIHLSWTLQDCGTAEEQGIVGYDVTWVNNVEEEERVVTLPHSANNYDIPVYHNRCTYKMNIHASQYDDMWQEEPLPSIHCTIQGPPDPPILCCTSSLQEEFILEWGEPRLYGGVAVRGYQIYMNDKKVGQELSASHYKAAIPCRPNRTYRMSIVALSADPNYRDSDLSQEVVITCWSPDSQSTRQVTSNAQQEMYCGQGDVSSMGPACPEDIAIGVAELSETVIVLEWRLPLLGLESQELVDRIKVSWSSVTKPKELEALLKSTARQYTIRGCAPGTNHFVVVMALDEGDRVLHRSRQVTIQTTAPLSTPHLRIRSCTYSGCILEWDKPTQFGNAHLTGYQLHLNGKDHDKLPAGATTYLFTSGRMCKEYNFTIQALCNIPHLHSQCSQPAIVCWPGVVPPALHRAATTKLNAIKVTWPEPKITGGVKVQHYKVMCIEESGAKAVPANCRQALKTSGPLPPDQRSAEFPHLSPHTAYIILLDTQVSGVGKAIRSRPMNKQYVARRPAPPSVRVRVRGLEERLALEMEACQLINTRHRLLQELISYQQGFSPNFPPAQMESDDHTAGINEALSALAEMEDQLFQVLETLLPYTGTVEVDIDWEAVPANKDVQMSGYKVLVNGKQHGFMLHSHIDHICLQLSAYDGLHKICVVAVTDHPVGNSDPSDVTVVDTSPFLPFTCYCLHSVHRKDSRHPQEGSCSYQQTLALELLPETSTILMGLHQQLDLSSRRIPPASVNVMDVFDKAPHLLVPTKLTNRCPTLLLFWTPWCLASQKTMDHFVDYARNRARKLIFLACCCNSTEAGSSTHLQTLSGLIMERCWQDDGVIRHSCSCSSNDTGLMPGSRVGSVSTERGADMTSDRGKAQAASSVVSVAELFGVVATPTIIILHPEGYLAWQGCYAANDCSSFTTMMDDTVDSVAKTSRLSSPRSNSPKLLSPSTSASSCTVNSLPPHPGASCQRADPPRSRPFSTSSLSTPSQPSGSSPRAKAIKQGRQPRQKMISVNHRPFSASKENGSSKTKTRPKSSLTI